jgi:hypothetical protein
MIDILATDGIRNRSPSNERPQTYALDDTVIGIGSLI